MPALPDPGPSIPSASAAPGAVTVPTGPHLIDAHGHLQAEPFAADVDGVMDAAARAGVVRLLVPGWDLASSRDAIAFVERPWPLRVLAAVGIHPHVSSQASQAGPAAWAELRAMAADPRVAAIGETGLDYDRLFAPRERQRANLDAHLALGRSTGKPLVLHCRSAAGQRDAQDELIAALRNAGVGDPAWVAALDGRPPAVLHSFSGPVDYAEAALELGLAISFSGLVFRRGEAASADVARLVPLDRLLVETDAPYLSPPGAPRRRNEPGWVRVTAAWVAQQRGEDPLRLGEALVAAYDAIFRGSTGGIQV
ncbi:MAG: TatD family hydrolase [Candidatus Limnocylindrales bacterium]